MRNNQPSFLFASHAQELNSVWQRRLFHIWNLAALLLSSAAVTVVSLLLGLGMFDVQFFFDYFRHPLIFLLNWIPVLLLQAALYGITGRQWSAYLGTSLLVLLASAASFYKLRFRSEPLLFSDLTLIGAALDVAGDFDLSPNIRLLLAAAIVPIGTLILLFFAKGRPARPVRLLLCLASVLTSGVLWVRIYSDEDFYLHKAVSPDHIRALLWNEMAFISKGSVYPFLHSICDVFEAPPEGYSEEETAALLASYPDAEIPEDRRVNLLVFPLESFCDYTPFGIQGHRPGFYDLYHKLEAESYTGDLIVNIVGGGTINTERCFLTGTTRLFPYSAPADSFVRTLRSLGYTALADHPHFGSFYSRIGVNSYLGFESFRYRDNYYEDQIAPLADHWMSDSFLFPEVLDQYLDHVAKGESVFSFTVTTQAHGGYTDPPYDGPEVFWEREGCSPETLSEVNTYFSKLADTQVHLAAAIERLRDDPAPVAVLVFGDHQPRLSGSSEFYRLAGLDFSGTTLESLRDSYTTRYLLWVNNAARELLGDDLVGEGPAVSPGFLMDLVFEKLGWRGSPFMQLEREVRSHIYAINTNGFYLTDEGLVSTLSDENAARLQQLEYAQYYLRTNFTDPVSAGKE